MINKRNNSRCTNGKIKLYKSREVCNLEIIRQILAISLIPRYFSLFFFPGASGAQILMPPGFSLVAIYLLGYY